MRFIVYINFSGNYNGFMAEERQYLHIAGHIPVKEAALRLGVSEDSVQKYIKKKSLEAKWVDGRYMIPEEAVQNFSRVPRGRKRKKPVDWRIYSDGVEVCGLRIDVQARAEQAAQLQQRLQATAEGQQHRFPGTMQRFILTHDDNPLALTILLVWKDSELLNEADLQRNLDAFEVEFADLLDWQTARYTRMHSPLHT
jgi:excisionase family DNA binding protein